MSDPTASATPVPRREVTQRPLRAIGLILLAVALFSLLDATSKILAADYSPIEVVWGRYLAILALLAPFVLRAPARTLRTVRPALQGLRGILVLLSALLFIAGLARLQMAEATAIAFASPLLVTALSIPLLGEHVGPRRWLAVAAGFVGVLVVIRPGAAGFDAAALFPLASASCWALSIIVTRRMRGDDAALTTLFYSTLVGFVVSGVLVPAVWIPPTPRAWMLMGLMAVFSAGGQYLLIAALMRGAASVVAPFSYSQMLWSILLGFFIFDAVPTTRTWLGAAVIIASGVYIAHRERLTQRARRLAES